MVCRSGAFFFFGGGDVVLFRGLFAGIFCVFLGDMVLFRWFVCGLCSKLLVLGFGGVGGSWYAFYFSP